MGKVFQIAGNYLLSEKLSAFNGWIYQEETGEFFGFCEETCLKAGGKKCIIAKGTKDELMFYKLSDDPQMRYLTGKFTKNGLTFYKLSNDPQISPQIFVVPDLNNPKGSWATLSTSSDRFKKQGEAKIEIKEDSSGKTEQFIVENYDLDMEVGYNAELSQTIGRCEEILIEH